jgi:hypothetical protein
VKFGQIFIVLVLLISSKIFAIEKFWEGIRVIEINYEQGTSYVLKQNSADTSEILDPKDKLDRYFLIRSGIKIPTSGNLRGTVTFFGAIPEKFKTCIGENLYDTSFSVGSNFLTALDKKKILSACVKFKVEDPQKGKLEFDPIQENCTLEKINDYSVLISAGDCFFKAIPRQLLSVKIHTDPNCTNISYLAEKNFSPMSIQADWNAYMYPDKTLGAIFHPIGDALWAKKIFINLNPAEAILKLESKYVKDQIVYRPNIFVFPDFMLSNFSVSNLKNSPGSYADLSFLISNYGAKDFCRDGICSNYGNYDLPFAPILTLFEVDSRNGKKIELNSFIMGDRIPGKWNGTFSSRVKFQSFFFEIGKKYLMEFTFSNPTDRFIELKELLKSSFGLNRGTLGRLGDTNTSFTTFGDLPTLGGLGTIGGLNTENGVLEGISSLPDGQIPNLLESFNDPTFPPEYQLICNKSMSFCQKANFKDPEKLSISFSIAGIGQNDKLDIGDSIVVERSGKFLPEYKAILDLKKKPSLKCGGIL